MRCEIRHCVDIEDLQALQIEFKIEGLLLIKVFYLIRRLHELVKEKEKTLCILQCYRNNAITQGTSLCKKPFPFAVLNCCVLKIISDKAEEGEVSI